MLPASRTPVAAASTPPSAAWTDLLMREGERSQPTVHTPFLLDDPEAVWFVEAGGLLVFTAVIDDGRAARHPHTPARCRARRVRLRVRRDRHSGRDRRARRRPLGHGAAPHARSAGFASSPGSIRTRLRSASTSGSSGVSSSLMRGMTRGARARHSTLVPHVPMELPALRRAAPSTGVVWIDVPSASVLYNDLVVPTFPDASRAVPVDAACERDAARSRERRGSGVTPLDHSRSSRAAAMWAGLRIFQHTALRCEVMNGRLARAEEFLRLEQKAHHSNAAQHRAYSAIGAVLQRGGGQAGTWTGPPPAEPVLWAAQLVGPGPRHRARRAGRRRRRTWNSMIASR